MAKTYSLVALLDVLGYRNHLKSDRSTGSEMFKLKLESALTVLASINETELSYQAISDTIIIAANQSTPIADFLLTVAAVQRAFLKSGLLIRGGIAYEQHFKSGNVTYSHALAVAYELEQKQAIYPRVVIDKGVIEMLVTGNRYSAKDVARLQDESIICVQNGIYFVNFIAKHIDDCYAMAKSIYESEIPQLMGREVELAKHRWLQDYLISGSDGKNQSYMGGIEKLYIVPAKAPQNAS